MDMIIRLLADGSIILVILISMYALLFKVTAKNRYDIYTRIFMSGITSYVLAKIIGKLIQPESLRPFEKMGVDPGAAYLNNPGFPSDHALLGFVLLFAVWFATRNKRLTMFLAVLVVCMCLGRVLALVHTPLDIMGSLIISICGTFWYANRKRNIDKKSNI